MNKLELAHEWAKSIGAETNLPLDILVDTCFDYAEAMLAENEKRQDKSRPEVLDYPEFDADVWYCDGAKVAFNGYVMEANMAKILFNNMVDAK